jgi:hypothetical protein
MLLHDGRRLRSLGRKGDVLTMSGGDFHKFRDRRLEVQAGERIDG